MAKSLGPKSRIIRAALAAHPEKGNTELAESLNDSADRLDDKFEFTAQEVASQKQAMKQPGAVKVDAAPDVAPVVEAAAEAEPDETHEPAKPAKKKPGRPKGSKKATAPVVVRTVTPAPKKHGTVEVLDGLFDLAKAVGGFDQLKHIVDKLAGR